MATGNGGGAGRRRTSARIAGVLLFLLAASFLVDGVPGSTAERLVPWARGGYLFLSLLLSVAFLHYAGTFRSAPPASAPGEERETGASVSKVSTAPFTRTHGLIDVNVFELEERNRELLAHHRCTKKMMRAHTPGAVFRILLEGIREGLGYTGAIMAFVDGEGNLVFPPAPEGDAPGFPGYSVPAASADGSYFFPFLNTDEPKFIEEVPANGAEEYGMVAGTGKALLVPLLHRGWSGDPENDEESLPGEGSAPVFRPAMLVLRGEAGGKEPTSRTVHSILSLLNEADYALEMTDLYRRLRSLSITDGLTGLLNHREFYERLTFEVDRAKRYGHNLSVLILDVDNFKGYNDTFGHPAGDSVLRILASLLRQSARVTDIVARYGGEEFAVILPEASSTGALLMAERIRMSLSEVNFSPLPDRKCHLTVSIGIYTSETGSSTVDTIVSMADDAAYRAKKDGKNRVIVRAGK